MVDQAGRTPTLTRVKVSTGGAAASGDVSDASRFPVTGSSAWAKADANLTRPGDATPYVLHGAIGAAAECRFVWTNFFEANGAHEVLTGLRLVFNLAAITVPAGAIVRAHLYNADPVAALSANADKAVFKTMVANQASKLGFVDFNTFNIGGTGSDCIESYGVPVVSPLHLKAASAARDLYALLECVGAFTPPNAGIILMYASRAGL